MAGNLRSVLESTRERVEKLKAIKREFEANLNLEASFRSLIDLELSRGRQSVSELEQLLETIAAAEKSSPDITRAL